MGVDWAAGIGQTDKHHIPAPEVRLNTLSLLPAEADQIGGSCFSMAVLDGRRVYFSDLEPFDSHPVSDGRALLLRIARFAEHGVRRAHLEAAFGVNRSTVQ